MERIAELLRQGKELPERLDGIKVYVRSREAYEGAALVMVKENGKKSILATGSGALYDDLQGEDRHGYKLCGLTHSNRLLLNQYFEYTVPRAFGRQVATMGLGDRLGLASPGHIQIFRGRDVYPILAQQSIREITLTGRTYEDVLDAACFAVFQEGYKDGFGADGDHLKEESDIQMSLDLGFTMLTLDCSEKLDGTVEGLDPQDIENKYNALPPERREAFEQRYLKQTFQVGAHSIRFDRSALMKNVLIYGEAIQFMEYIYNKYIQNAPRPVDFEISIDETSVPTEPASHYFVANELILKGVDIFSMAPRFCGEFQKGIDYIGDLAQFEAELQVHTAIADHFGYKLSIHSGSDKFSVFALIAKYTRGRFHLKTAGTNWLEAMRVISRVNPSLYRRMHQYALEHFNEAAAYYHVTADIDAIVPLKETADADLPGYMNEPNARQLIHITYGILLQAKSGEDGKFLFRDEFMKTMVDEEEEYDRALREHIGKHLQLLGK